jgi:CRISPR-associated protein Csb1
VKSHVSSSKHRWLFEVDLQPVSGSRFQPTGFPDIGAAVFDRPRRGESGAVSWEQALLVESAQSMANRLEATAWDEAVNDQHALFAGLPYVRVVRADDEGYLTSSRTEAHRLASAFVKQSSLDGVEMTHVIRERLNLRDDRPLAPREIAAAVFGLDPFCLLHGVFFAESAKVWPGQPRIPRATTGSIEAHDVRRADSGGVKKDHVRHSLGESTGGTAEGYGTVPFHRTEWTAAEIVASFNLDRSQIRAYGLGAEATELLESIALWEIRTLLDDELRLRTACDLVPIDREVKDHIGELLPEAATLEKSIEVLIPAVGDLAGDGQPITVRWGGGKAKDKG